MLCVPYRIINVRGHVLGPGEQVYPAFEPHPSDLSGLEAFTLDYNVSIFLLKNLIKQFVNHDTEYVILIMNLK